MSYPDLTRMQAFRLYDQGALRGFTCLLWMPPQFQAYEMSGPNALAAGTGSGIDRARSSALRYGNDDIIQLNVSQLESNKAEDAHCDVGLQPLPV